MNNQETIKICVEEFSRLQEWMEMTEKETPLYKSMKVRYRDLKVILSALGVNVTELDTIKEQCIVRGADQRKRSALLQCALSQIACESHSYVIEWRCI